MPYCRRCGTELEQDAYFCYKCGTPVANYEPPPPMLVQPAKLIRKKPLVLLAIILIALLITAVLVAAIVAAPVVPVNFNLTGQDSHSGINTLNLNFQVDIADVNIITQNVNIRNILIVVIGNGSRGIFDSENPVQVTFNNQTVDDVLTFTSKVTQTNTFSTRLQVVCTIYVNPDLNLNLNVTSQTGQVSLTADKPTTIQSLNLQTTTGTVQANFQNITIAGNISLKTQTGNLHYRMFQNQIAGTNQTIHLQSTSGSISMDIKQTTAFQGDLQVNASTTTGSINVGLTIDGDVGAKITSHSGMGNIRLQDIRSFSGNQSPIQSNNYPATANININNQVSVGDINIKAAYQSSITPTLKN